jgi:hypothetical protein
MTEGAIKVSEWVSLPAVLISGSGRPVEIPVRIALPKDSEGHVPPLQTPTDYGTVAYTLLQVRSLEESPLPNDHSLKGDS